MIIWTSYFLTFFTHLLKQVDLLLLNLAIFVYVIECLVKIARLEEVKLYLQLTRLLSSFVLHVFGSQVSLSFLKFHNFSMKNNSDFSSLSSQIFALLKNWFWGKVYLLWAAQQCENGFTRHWKGQISCWTETLQLRYYNLSLRNATMKVKLYCHWTLRLENSPRLS
jgi:hypothetical protein